MIDLKLKLYMSVNEKLDAYPDFFYVNENFNLNYDSILKIWSDYVCKNYSDLFSTLPSDEIYQEDNKSHQNIVNLCKNSTELPMILEDLFNYHIGTKDDDLIIFYIKGSDKVLLKLKSYSPLIYDKTKVMPFWNLYVRQANFIDSIEKYATEYPKGSLCILCF